MHSVSRYDGNRRSSTHDALGRRRISSLGGKNGKRNKYLYFFRSSPSPPRKKGIARHEKRVAQIKTENRREHQRDEKRARGAKKNSKKASATKREKYVKINWKSIECDVKIKFIRAATRARSPWEFRRGHCAMFNMDMIRSTFLFARLDSCGAFTTEVALTALDVSDVKSNFFQVCKLFIAT